MTSEQMQHLAARLQQAANERGRLPNDSEALAADLDSAADLIEQMAQAEPVAWQYWNDKSNSWNTTTSKVVADAMHESGRVVAPLYLAPPAREPAPTREIGNLLNLAMDQAVANGADSRSMPDEYVTVAAWLTGQPTTPPAREPLTEQEIWDAVLHGAVGGIGFISKAVSVARAIEQAHGIGSEKCWCRACLTQFENATTFVVCPKCGNKRCPKAADHRNVCTGSNEPGQVPQREGSEK